MSAPRLALATDLAALAEIERASFGRADAADSLASELQRAWSRIYVDERAGAVAGFVNVWRVADEVEVLFVATAPAWRRRGVARVLLSHALRVSREEGATRALLEVRRSNAAAIALYSGLAFEVVGVRARYYDDGEDALLMAASL